MYLLHPSIAFIDRVLFGIIELQKRPQELSSVDNINDLSKNTDFPTLWLKATVSEGPILFMETLSPPERYNT